MDMRISKFQKELVNGNLKFAHHKIDVAAFFKIISIDLTNGMATICQIDNLQGRGKGNLVYIVPIRELKQDYIEKNWRK